MRHAMRAVAAAALVWSGVPTAAAMPNDPTANDWVKVWGPTEFVVIDKATGTVYAKPLALKGATPAQTDIHAWLGRPTGWTPLGTPGGKKYVAAGWKGSSTLFCLTPDGVVHRYGGTPNNWQVIGGPVGGKAGDLFGGPDALLATAPGTPADVYRWDGKPNC